MGQLPIHDGTIKAVRSRVRCSVANPKSVISANARLHAVAGPDQCPALWNSHIENARRWPVRIADWLIEMIRMDGRKAADPERHNEC